MGCRTSAAPRAWSMRRSAPICERVGGVMAEIEFALVLNLHQPSGNLEQLLDARDWQASEILWAIDRIPRSLWQYEDVGRVHLSLSGSLLESLANPDFQRRVYGVVDCGSLLWYLQNTRIIEILEIGRAHV